MEWYSEIFVLILWKCTIHEAHLCSLYVLLFVSVKRKIEISLKSLFFGHFPFSISLFFTIYIYFSRPHKWRSIILSSYLIIVTLFLCIFSGTHSLIVNWNCQFGQHSKVHVSYNCCQIFLHKCYEESMYHSVKKMMSVWKWSIYTNQDINYYWIIKLNELIV